MKFTRLAIAGGAFGFLLLVVSIAQSQTASGLDQPASVRNVLFKDNYLYFAPDDKSSQPPAPPEVAEREKKAEAAPAEEKKEEAAEEEEKAPEPKRLIGNLGCTKINITGWLDAGITGNADNPASNYNGVLAPNDRNLPQLNQFYLVMERKIEYREKLLGFRRSH